MLVMQRIQFCKTVHNPFYIVMRIFPFFTIFFHNFVQQIVHRWSNLEHYKVLGSHFCFPASNIYSATMFLNSKRFKHQQISFTFASTQFPLTSFFLLSSHSCVSSLFSCHYFFFLSLIFIKDLQNQRQERSGSGNIFM